MKGCIYQLVIPSSCHLVISSSVSFHVEGLFEKLKGTTSRVDGVVTVTAELHVHSSLVADLFESLQHGAEVDFAFAEHQVLVNPFAHVLNVNVPDQVAPLADMVGNGHLA